MLTKTAPAYREITARPAASSPSNRRALSPASRMAARTHIHDIPISDDVSLVPVPRDDAQSTVENKIRMDHEKQKAFNAGIGPYNKAGPSQILMIENVAGAQCQVDGLCGRDPYETIRQSVSSLELHIGARPLIRGSNGVGLKVLHPQDLERVLRYLAEAAGATEGRLVTFKLFEAQNRPEDLIPALKILSKLRREGYNIECELAECYTADAVNDLEQPDGPNEDPRATDFKLGVIYNAAYYENKTYDLLKSYERLKEIAAAQGDVIDPDLVTAIGIKDMIGMLLGNEGAVEDGNSYETTKACLRGMQRFLKEYPDSKLRTFCMHNHNTGHGVAALAASIAAFLDEKEQQGPDSSVAKMKMRGDVIPDGSSFAGPKDVNEELKAEYGYDLGISPEQNVILDQWNLLFAGLKRFYNYCLIKLDLLSGEQKRFAFIAGGALGSDERKAMNPLAPQLVSAFKAAGVEIDAKTAKSMIKGLFIYVRRQLYFDNGHPHSVTPAAFNLSISTKDIIDGMIREGFVKEMLDAGIDLAAVGESKDLSVKIPKKWVARFSEFYTHINHAASIDYFRRYPYQIHPVLLKHYCSNHINKAALPPMAELKKTKGTRTAEELVDVALNYRPPLSDIIRAANFNKSREAFIQYVRNADGSKAPLEELGLDPQTIAQYAHDLDSVREQYGERTEQDLLRLVEANLPIKFLVPENYDEIQEGLLARAANKNDARTFLGRYSTSGDDIDKFVKEHIGMNEMAADHGAKEFGNIIEREARACQAAEKLKISLEGAIFHGLNIGLNAVGNVGAEIRDLWENPASLSPQTWWNFFFDKWGKSSDEIHEYEKATQPVALTERQLAEALVARLTANPVRLFGGFLEGCRETLMHAFDLVP